MKNEPREREKKIKKKLGDDTQIFHLLHPSSTALQYKRNKPSQGSLDLDGPGTSCPVNPYIIPLPMIETPLYWM
jgi:hypothetical protein